MKNYGWNPDRGDFRDQKLGLSHVTVGNSDNRAGFPYGCLDQGDLGSCTAHMADGLFAYEHKRLRKEVKETSRLFVYYNTRLMEGTVDSDSGASIRDTIQSMNQFGGCLDRYWKYDVTKYRVTPPKIAYKNGLVHTALKYARVGRGQEMITLLAGGQVFGCGITVYESFENDSTGNIVMPGKKESVLGGHAIVICGYQAGRGWLFRNSWGVGWGNMGYGWLPEAYLLDDGLSDDFWAVTLVS